MQRFRKIILLSAFLPAMMPLAATAAVVSLDTGDEPLGIGSRFEIAVKLDTAGEELNAFEGAVIIPSELVQIEEIRDGNSIIDFWVERPHLQSSQKIAFSGITAGGYRGEDGLIFSVVLMAEGSGSVPISMDNVKLLKNDGRGTLAEASLVNLAITIQPVGRPGGEEEAQDRDAPETFVPEVAREESLFSGQWFLVFATQDKQSGIDHYEVREGRWGNFSEAASPYVLQNQELDKQVFIKAVDKAGNERNVTLDLPNYQPWYKNLWLIFILIAGIITVRLILNKERW